MILACFNEELLQLCDLREGPVQPCRHWCYKSGPSYSKRKVVNEKLLRPRIIYIYKLGKTYGWVTPACVVIIWVRASILPYSFMYSINFQEKEKWNEVATRGVTRLLPTNGIIKKIQLTSLGLFMVIKKFTINLAIFIEFGTAFRASLSKSTAASFRPCSKTAVA